MILAKFMRQVIGKVWQQDFRFASIADEDKEKRCSKFDATKFMES